MGGETLALKVVLIEATENWETFTGKGVPYPVAFELRAYTRR